MARLALGLLFLSANPARRREVAAVVGNLVMGKITSATGKMSVGQKVRFRTAQL
jgi:hypothetical protein